MLIEDWQIKRVRPYPNNPRVLRNAAEKVAESIRAFGWRQPIVVDADGVVIAGHSRLEAAKLLKLKTVPVHVAQDLTPDQVRALRIADNKTATFSGWDDARLADELVEIMSGVFTGFSQSELDAILMSASAEVTRITAPADDDDPDDFDTTPERVDKADEPEHDPDQPAPPELELLRLSILEDGWTQPIVVLPDMTIIDGFHRWTVSADQAVRALTGGLVPVVVVDADPVHRMMSTIRHNRARGTHAVRRMAEIVRGMAESGLPASEICRRLGMEDEELERLLDRSGMTARGTAGVNGFGRAWVPERKKIE